MTKFKIGDVVICNDVTDAENELVLYGHYSILFIKNYGGNDFEYIIDEPSGLTWREDRFELVKSASEESDPEHQDIYQQLAEAKRLLNKAAEFLEHDPTADELAEEISSFLGED